MAVLRIQIFQLPSTGISLASPALRASGFLVLKVKGTVESGHGRRHAHKPGPEGYLGVVFSRETEVRRLFRGCKGLPRVDNGVLPRQGPLVERKRQRFLPDRVIGEELGEGLPVPVVDRLAEPAEEGLGFLLGVELVLPVELGHLRDSW
jgi:hypothetical protein